MASETAAPPRRDLAWVLSQSAPTSLAALVIGAAGLALIVLGTPVILAVKDVTPVESMIAALKSEALRGLLWTGSVLGGVGVVLGVAVYSRMSTKISREEAIAGTILGAQAAALGALILWFVSGDVSVFAINFLNFEAIGPQMDAFVNGAKNTLFLALTSEALGIALGLLVAVFTISKRAVVRAPARAYINFFRGTPLIWQMSFIGVGIAIAFQLNIGPYQAAIIALTFNAGAYIAEVFRAGIQSIERGQLEAARGLGMSYLQAMRYAVIPQAVRRVIPPLMNEFVILIKDTSLVIILGLSAGQRELMSVGSQGLSNTFNATFLIMTAAGYLVISLPMIRMVNALEKRLRSGLVGVGA